MTGADKKILANIVRSMVESPEDPLTPLVDKYLIRRANPKYRHLRLKSFTIETRPRLRPGGRLSPSTLCGCERQAAFKFLGVEGHIRINPDTEIIFDDGDWHHHKWGFRFVEMERILGSENFRCVSLEESVEIPGLYIAGSLDMVLWIKGFGYIVVDVKSINSYGMSSVTSAQSPKPEHVRQLITYMRARKIRMGMVLYDSKNDSQYEPFMVKFNKAEWEFVRLWAKRVMKQIEDQKLPPKAPDCDRGNFLYERCAYRKLCFGKIGNRKLERQVYADFPGTDELWRRGHEIIQEDEAAD